MSPQEEHEPSRKPPQRAECPDTWGSDRDRPEATETDHTQKRTGDKTSLKDAITRVALLENLLFQCWSTQGSWPAHTPSVLSARTW